MPIVLKDIKLFLSQIIPIFIIMQHTQNRCILIRVLETFTIQYISITYFYIIFCILINYFVILVNNSATMQPAPMTLFPTNSHPLLVEIWHPVPYVWNAIGHANMNFQGCIIMKFCNKFLELFAQHQASKLGKIGARPVWP